ncbi:calcium/proton exchanger Cax [Nitzschia inconspicua]|uniref:Calcium/proton exchanger Cax n=1 Tax=Nitzschia inconspicua TaxID=303405 RepID=A0A9K3PNQ8_9STRA|nr:calcium/proton exchanger Cax [Nitzschia inconspicua]
MSRNQSLGEEPLDSLQHSSNTRDSTNNGRGHRAALSDSNFPTLLESCNNGATGHFVSSMSMLHPMEVSENAAVGEVGTFRSRAMARRFINTSRRKLLEKNASVKSMASTDSDVVNVGETTPLVRSIPEDRSSTNLDMMGSEASVPKDDEEPQNIWKNFFDFWFGKPVSIFLLATPLALWATVNEWSGAWIFWTNFFVLLPLASILGDFTEEAALHTNETIGGLLNATFGNCVEVIVALQALLRDEIRVVQASMIGSIFSNLLLVLGCCFLFGGYFYKEQKFNMTSATASMGLLALSSLALVLPTPYAKYFEVQDQDVLMISRAAALVLFSMYVQLLFFQLHTHRDFFENKAAGKDGEGGEADDDEEEEVPSIPMWMALFGLGIVTLLVAWFSDALVGSIDDFCEETGVSRTFVGLIILPIVGNAVEHITAVNVAMKNKMDLSLGVAIGSCTQIALFVVPITVIVGWCTNKNMTLNFPHFEICLYVLSIFTVTIALGTGRSNWLLGSLLVTTYVMIAIGFWFEKVVNF